MGEIDLGNLSQCLEEARAAALEKDAGPADPHDFGALMSRLEKAREKLPPLYRKAVWEPFVVALRELGAIGLRDVLAQDPERTGVAALVLDVAQALLQNAEGGEGRIPLGAFQEVLSDLYDGFLSAEDRRGVKPPDKETLAPLAKFGCPEFGPYTMPVDATEQIGVRAAIVSLPPANARRGLVAWAALGHETAGHDVLGADTGLREELQDALHRSLSESRLGKVLPGYWSDRIEETAADVLGILNMGPAAAIALVVYFRALNAAYGGRAALRSVGPAADSHPADIVRGYLAASVVRELEFGGADAWASAIMTELEKDVHSAIVLAGHRIDEQDARTSATVAAHTIMTAPMAALEGHALGAIQNWRDEDEKRVHSLCLAIAAGGELPARQAAGFYAAHAVAAGVTMSLRAGSDVGLVFRRTIAQLASMHARNPSWGPLGIAHPGDLVIRRAYRVQAMP